ncbi:MAG: hypothetical protein K1X49_02990 [Saprospiraceae bacterium]|jgi:hypothetical protein|nr:hypothetical protein [Saprospiraceae bacterium]
MTIENFRTWFILLSMPISMLAIFFLDKVDWGWIGGAVWSFGFAAMYIIYAQIKKDVMMWRFVLFTVAAGFTELIADKWIVDTHTLFYPPDEPFLVASPIYMPFSWVVVLIQIGYIGHLFHHKFNIVLATIFTGVLGCSVIPFYEYLAIHAGWWHYENAHFWGIVPRYIYMAEGMLMLTIPYLFDHTLRQKYRMVIFLGVLQGLVMLIASIFAFHFFS